MITDSLLDRLLAGADAMTAFEADGLPDKLKKALAEQAPNAEMDHRLVNGAPGNSRNGYGRKMVTTGAAKIELEMPAASTRGLSPSTDAASPTSTRRSSRFMPLGHERERDRRPCPGALRRRRLARPNQHGRRRGA